MSSLKPLPFPLPALVLLVLMLAFPAAAASVRFNGFVGDDSTSLNSQGSRWTALLTYDETTPDSQPGPEEAFYLFAIQSLTVSIDGPGGPFDFANDQPGEILIDVPFGGEHRIYGNTRLTGPGLPGENVGSTWLSLDFSHIFLLSPLTDDSLPAEWPNHAEFAVARLGIAFYEPEPSSSRIGVIQLEIDGTTIVPEPSSAVLIGLGLTGLAHQRRGARDRV